MNEKVAGLTSGRLVSSLAVLVILGAVTACGGGSASSGTSAASVMCTNYAIHGTGKYHDEVWVQVSVSNPTPQPVNYTIDVDMTAADPAGSSAPAMHVAITGLVASKTSAELSRKVLSVSQVQHCQIAHLSPS